ncbi:MAG: DcrB-related protein [Muribaculaceae bacterium]|nr:DcrB-related protein [Muribaculaceae bacterium]
MNKYISEIIPIVFSLLFIGCTISNPSDTKVIDKEDSCGFVEANSQIRIDKDHSDTQDMSLAKSYSNEFFSLRYPKTWRISSENRTSEFANVPVSLSITDDSVNDDVFRSNINFIISEQKWKESARFLAQQSSDQQRQIIPNYKLLGISDTSISGCKGCLSEYVVSINGYTLRGRQYIVKKSDNTTYTITATTDDKFDKTQLQIINQIINSITIK